AGEDKTVRVWDLDTGQQQAKLSGHNSPVGEVAVSADGRRAVSAGHRTMVRVWDLADGKWVVPARQRLWRRFREWSPAFALTIWTSSLAISADGRRAVSCGLGRRVRVWDLDTGQQQAKLSGHHSPVDAVAVSA